MAPECTNGNGYAGGISAKMGSAISTMKIIESVEIPTYSENKSRWEIRADLSGRRYTFNVSYNTRQEAWLMPINDVNGNLLLSASAW